MTALNPDDLQKMTAREVAALADVDHYAVRDEGFRRQAVAETKLARLQKQITKAHAEMMDAGKIIGCAFSEQRRKALHQHDDCS